MKIALLKEIASMETCNVSVVHICKEQCSAQLYQQLLCSSIKCSTVQWIDVQCSTVQYCAVLLPVYLRILSSPALLSCLTEKT